ncbi:MAG: DMT family transporter [Desulfarculaceae bacterium]|nr:DMT family transporter [Desulfarculaceae bacterium]
MSWFWLAVGAAFFLATSDFLLKRNFSDLPVGQMILVRLSGLLPAGLALLLLAPIPPIKPQFYWSVALALPAEILALYLYNRAIQASPLALSLPFLSFTPLFVAVIGFLVLGESLDGWGLGGIVLVVIGAYTLNLHTIGQGGWSQPIRAIFREKGSWMILLTSLLYAYTLTMCKNAMLGSSPWFMAGVYPSVLAILVVAGMGVAGRLGWDWLRRPWGVAGVGLSTVAMVICHYWALSMAPAAYMIAVKRLSILMAVAYGGVFLKEARLGQHLLAGGLMVGGAVVILLWG